MTSLATVTALLSWRFVLGAEFANDSPLAYHFTVNPISATLHFICAPLALLVGGFQFLASLRTKQPRIHRSIGFIYIVCCLLGGLGAIPLALITEAQVTASLGFMMLAIFWLFTTSMGAVTALKKAYKTHQKWMLRSFSLTYAAVTLRLYLGLLGLIYGEPSPVLYSAVAWACWVPNLVFAEYFIVRHRTALRNNTAEIIS